MDTESDGQSFPSTHWSQIKQASHDRNPEKRSAALQELVQRYYNPLRYHLQRVKGIPPQNAEDLLHNFLCSKFLQEAFLSRADQNRGRFRTFLLNALDRYVISQYRKATAVKRAPEERIPLDEAEDHIGREDNPEHTFHVQWAQEVLRQAAQRMHDYCLEHDRHDVWFVFKKRQIEPALEGVSPMPYTQLVEQLGSMSPAQVQNLLVTAKRMFTRCLYAVVEDYEGGAKEAEREIRELRGLLSR